MDMYLQNISSRLPEKGWWTSELWSWTSVLVQYYGNSPKNPLSAKLVDNRAILQENGGAWSVTKYLTLGQILQPMAEAPSQLPGHHYKS